jgi:uncharacterized damage-inducible protein DinB
MSQTLSGIGYTHFRFHRWAFERYFAALEQLPEEKLNADSGLSFGSIYKTLLHVAQADGIWSFRLTGYAPVPPADGSLATLKESWFRALDELSIWLGGLAEDAWSTEAEYSNSKGVKFRTPVWQIVLHLVNHGTAHRGQICTVLRQIGVTPPPTDEIIFYRLEAGQL